MLHFIADLPFWTALPIGILIAGGMGVLIAESLCRVRSPAWQTAFRTIQATLVSPLMVAYAIFAVIIINTSWHNHQSAVRAAHAEDFAIRHLHSHMPAAGIGPALLARYVQSVIEQEWTSMHVSHEHPATTQALLDLRAWILAPDIPYANSLSERFFHETFHEVVEARQQRLSISRQEIPEILWAALGICSVVVLSGVAMAHAHNRRTAWMMVSLYGTIIGVMVVSILEIYHPYSGSVVVTPESLELLLDRIEETLTIGMDSRRS
ncbi:MAG: DUF4239 domain-containing protein [Sphingobacteriia bacterium]|nr:DUF4239 domain-containing protein [Sphingobacteriia bacterium]NCC38663.1 DUF4239 domain-containing protein [Gammaproteobacteria bacterium]